MRGTRAHGFGFSDSIDEETRFVWDGSNLLLKIQPDGKYAYIYTSPDSYEPLALGIQLDNRRSRKRPTSPLLPLRSNRHSKRDDRQGQQFVVDRQLHRLGSSEKGKKALDTVMMAANGNQVDSGVANQVYKKINEYFQSTGKKPDKCEVLQ